MLRDVFIPMAGVAEFTMGFGLIWTPLVRRLSAVALFIIFNAAVYPFGRIDMVGHALIMAIIVAVAADHTREVRFLPALKRSLAGVPVGLTAAIVIFVSGYWGLHLAFYGPDGRIGAPIEEIATQSYSPEHTHGPQAVGRIGAPPDRGLSADRPNRSVPSPNSTSGATAAFLAAMDRMHKPMMDGINPPDPDVALSDGV
jgi:hypothetical protein